ncbi:MAG: hypothetical protein NC038_04060 [Paludibacter sp.]|nr:hypothetical protein [Bacteroides sp.]MCM1403035.1 hypothetical protein [Bacteroides sp.]MCM1442828.1 hypothetical protein [Muribaculum sp.]MCM1481806.1 hypothetical protein [Paludibacter sp.]MCM1576191.1 hypothetical protein [Bacteroides sp.]
MAKTIKETNVDIFKKILEDKNAIRDCIWQNGDMKQLGHERGIKFATPV